MSGEEYKYQKEWNDFQDNRGFGCLLGLIIIPILIATIYISENFPPYSTAAVIIAVTTFLAVAFLSFVNGRAKCPCCKKPFDHSKARNVRNCINYNLPVFYGSSFFYDFWGTEQGNDLAEKIKKNEL